MRREQKRMRRKQRKQERTEIRHSTLQAKNEFLGFNPTAVANALRYFVRDAATVGIMTDAAATEEWISTCTEDVGKVCRPAGAGGIALACGTLPEAASWACKAARVCGLPSSAVLVHRSGLHEVELHAGPGAGVSRTWRSIAVGDDGTLLPPLTTTLQLMIGAALRDLRHLCKAVQPADEAAARAEQVGHSGVAAAVAPGSGSGPCAHRQRRGTRRKSSGHKSSGQKSGGWQGAGRQGGVRSRRGDIAVQAAEQPVAFVRGGILNDASSSRQMVEVEEAQGAQGGRGHCGRTGPGAGAGSAMNASLSQKGDAASPRALAVPEDADVALLDVGGAAVMDGVAVSAADTSPSAATAAVALAETAEPAVLLGLQLGLGLGRGGSASGPGGLASEGPQALVPEVVGHGVSMETAGAGGAAVPPADAVPMFDLEYGGFMLTAGADSAANGVRAAVPQVRLVMSSEVLAVCAVPGVGCKDMCMMVNSKAPRRLKLWVWACWWMRGLCRFQPSRGGTQVPDV